MNKYEQLIEFIINEQEDKARELFHQIVVAKSRDIYENLMDESDFDEAVHGEENEVDSLSDEISADENGMSDDGEEVGMDDMDGEEGDMGDMGDMDGEMGDMDGGEEEGGMEERVMDLETALDDLKAEFEKLMSGEEEEPEHDDMFAADEEGGEMEVGEFGSEEPETESFMREYVEKVAKPSNTEGADNKQSIVAKPNRMGGTSANIAKGGAEANPTSATQPTNAYAKGKTQVPGAGSFENVPGAKTKGYTTKAGAKKAEGSTTDGSVPVSKRSIEGS
jgi:hypothetical protein